MSQLPNVQFARLLLEKIAEAIPEIEVSNSFTLATAGQLITMEDAIWPEARVAVCSSSRRSGRPVPEDKAFQMICA
ncbi:hypothetical protein [Mesorhizobium sangaii]|uniref:Uncharacterized protein n=1 Tax=Mesorhizobium sangaii TaxID=505389 RepID=A0A841PGB4_9HYPH|nr:hypothetical protein [Mesorhizobium sangaii]MBB6409232.1 hypothetical protein [Mesorhizobium sangaii]